MKHHIYVSLSEFLANGGKLIEERKVFYLERNVLNSYNLFGYYIKQLEDGTHLAKNSSFKTFPISDQSTYVMVEVTPIWI